MYKPVLLFGILSIIISTIITYAFFTMSSNSKNYSENVSQSLSLNSNVIVNHIEPWREIAKKIANERVFDIEKWNCWDFATRLKRELIKVGYGNTKIIMGMYGKYPHAWVELDEMWIESTTGDVITNKSLYKFGYYATDKFNYYR